MKGKRGAAFLMALMMLTTLLAGCGSKEPEEPKTYRILFIGNSYTYYHDMPTAMFARLVEQAGYQVEVTAITKGAHTLEKFADPFDTYGSEVAAALDESRAGCYDYVILQEQSFRAIGEPASFYDAVRDLAGRIRAIGAEPVLYATWGYKEGYSVLQENNLTSEQMTWKMAAAYTAIGEELDIPVAYVGLAFREMYTTRPLADVYAADKSHPSTLGSYLAAVTIFSTIFEQDPTAMEIKGMAPEQYKGLLNEAAKNAVFNTPEIPAEYRTSSAGVTGK